MTLALRRLLLVAAAVVLLGHGGVELAPRLVTTGASVAAVSGGTPSVGRPATSRPAAESQPAERGATVRAAAAVAVPAGITDSVAGPARSPLVARHLAARPVVRPPSVTRVQQVAWSVSGRAPPLAAGT